MPIGINTSLIALVVVGIIGFMIIYVNNSDKPLEDIIMVEEFGYLLLGFAVCVGLMYTLTPIPTVNVKNKEVELILEGGEDIMEFESGSVLDTITGGYLQRDTNTTLPTSHITY